MVYSAYDNASIKKQVVPKTKQGIANINLDYKGMHFKYLRNLAKNDIISILEKVANGELSFQEMAYECHQIKQRRVIKDRFVEQLGLADWDEAQIRYPKHMTDATLDQFIDIPFMP